MRRTLWRFPGGSNLAIWIVVLVAVVWAIECWLVQNHTLKLDIGGEVGELEWRSLKRGAARFVINLAAALCILAIFPSRWLVALFGASLVLSAVLLVFYEYYGDPLTWSILAGQFGEGLRVSGSLLPLLDVKWLAVLSVMFVAKTTLLEVARKKGLRHYSAFGYGAVCLFLYVTTASTLLYLRPLEQIRTWHSFSYVGSLYGYFPTWLAEYLYFDNALILEKAKASLGKTSRKFDGVPLVAREPSLIVVIQAESLDFQAIETITEDGPLMPFLREFTRLAAVCPIEPVHVTGSADADFSLLVAAPPNGIVTPYKVPGFDFGQSIVSKAKRRGYVTSVYHGNSGSFFARRTAFREMGFDRIYFREEMESDFSGDSKWGIPDDAVFGIVSKHIRRSVERSFAMIITLTTHTPFRYLMSSERELFDDPETIAQRYLNNMRYLDRSLDRFVHDLPSKTLVFIYADHTSNVAYRTLPHVEESKSRTVPFIAYQKNGDAKRLQKQFDAVADANASLVDAANYVHRHVEGE